MNLAQVHRFGLLQALLRPAIRYCVRNAIGIQEVSEAVKGVFVELAVAEMAKKGEQASVSRVSVISGMHRRDVTRMLREGARVESSPPLMTRVMSQWEQDKRFQSKSGKPRVLSCKGEESEFARLVRSVSNDIGPAAVLFHLEQMGMVERVEDGVRMVRVENYVTSDPEQGLQVLAADNENLVRAVEQNLFLQQATRNLHLRTEYDNVSKTDIATIRSWVHKEGARFHKKLRDFISRFDQDINPSPKKEGGGKVVVTSFSLTE